MCSPKWPVSGRIGDRHKHLPPLQHRRLFILHLFVLILCLIVVDFYLLVIILSFSGNFLPHCSYFVVIFCALWVILQLSGYFGSLCGPFFILVIILSYSVVIVCLFVMVLCSFVVDCVSYWSFCASLWPFYVSF